MTISFSRNTVLVAAIAVIIGFVAGLAVGSCREGRYSERGYRSSKAVHMMPSGSMMENDDSSMVDMMRSMNVALEGKTGDDFDQAFLDEMIVHHQGAVQMAELASSSAKHQEIKDLAAAIVAAQNEEIGRMQSWQRSWYGR